MANGQYFPPGRGGNDPARQAAIQQLSKVPTSRPDVQAPAPGPGPMQGPAPQGVVQPMAQGMGMGNQPPQNEVAFHLANAFQAFVQSGPSVENLSAVQQFVESIMELNNPQAMQQAGQAAPAGAPMGGAPPAQPSAG